MKYSLFILLIFVACQSKKKETEPSINGKWVYETIELYGGEKFDLGDSLYSRLHQQHIGLTLSFSGKKTFSVTQTRPGQAEEFIGRQDYKLDGDTILRLINTGRPDDTFPIEGLTDSIFKVNLFNSPMGYLVLRRSK
jgi:hypothetical protein